MSRSETFTKLPISHKPANPGADASSYLFTRTAPTCFYRARFLSKTIDRLSDIYAENPTITEDAALDRYLFPYPYSAINLVRHTLLHSKKPYEETDVELCDWIFRVAQVQFPQQSLLVLALSSYRSLVKQDIQGGHNQAEIG